MEERELKEDGARSLARETTPRDDTPHGTPHCESAAVRNRHVSAVLKRT
jgi:hypothetical protein